MAKARMLSRSACSDTKLNRVSVEAQLLYLLTIPNLDRDGLVSGRPSWLAGHCLTERPELHTRVGSFVDEWVTHGLVTRYQGHDGAVIFFHGFRKHNANLAYEREQPSEYAPPPGYHRTKSGLVPDDPELAGRLLEAFDTRSTYRAALTEAAKELAVDSGKHNEITTSSRPDHDEYNRREVQQQTEVEVEVKVNNNSALRELTRKEAETAVVVVGVESLLASMDDDQVMDLLTWLWLYNGWNQKDLSYRDIFRRAYASDPFAGMKQIGAVMVTNARARSPAPLVPDDRADLMEQLQPLPIHAATAPQGATSP